MSVNCFLGLKKAKNYIKNITNIIKLVGLTRTIVADLFGMYNLKSLLSSTATAVHWLFSCMLGTSPRFSRFNQSEPFDFPSRLYLPDCEILNERHFSEFLIRNDWVQRILGIKMFPSNGLFPDITGEIYDETHTTIKVELEYRAENYVSHHHLYNGCDLILSFLRKEETKYIKGIPVWSFYKEVKGDPICDITLRDDINTDFNKFSSLSEEEYNKYQERKWLRYCQNCGGKIYIKGMKTCILCKQYVIFKRKPKKIKK